MPQLHSQRMQAVWLPGAVAHVVASAVGSLEESTTEPCLVNRGGAGQGRTGTGSGRSAMVCCGSWTGSSATRRSGTTPAHTGRSMSSASSMGPPRRTLADPSVMSQPQHQRGAQLGGVGRAGHRAPAGEHVLDDRVEGVPLGRLVLHLRGLAEEHHRAVVHRVVERRAGEHEAVEERDGDAHLAAGERPQHGVADRAVEVEVIAVAPVGHGQHPGRPVDHEPDVGDVRLVDHRVDQRLARSCPGRGGGGPWCDRWGAADRAWRHGGRRARHGRGRFG